MLAGTHTAGQTQPVDQTNPLLPHGDADDGCPPCCEQWHLIFSLNAMRNGGGALTFTGVIGIVVGVATDAGIITFMGSALATIGAIGLVGHYATRC